MNSRGAATECSPGREPGVFFRHDLSPGAKESFGVFRPFGAAFPNDTYPGLAPGATLCRRSAADINVVTSGAFTAAYTSWPAVLGCQVRHAGRRLAMMGRLLVRVSKLD